MDEQNKPWMNVPQGRPATSGYVGQQSVQSSGILGSNDIDFQRLQNELKLAEQQQQYQAYQQQMALQQFQAQAQRQPVVQQQWGTHPSLVQGVPGGTAPQAQAPPRPTQQYQGQPVMAGQQPVQPGMSGQMPQQQGQMPVQQQVGVQFAPPQGLQPVWNGQQWVYPQPMPRPQPVQQPQSVSQQQVTKPSVVQPRGDPVHKMKTIIKIMLGVVVLTLLLFIGSAAYYYFVILKGG
jgi:hypothetical protein